MGTENGLPSSVCFVLSYYNSVRLIRLKDWPKVTQQTSMAEEQIRCLCF